MVRVAPRSLTSSHGNVFPFLVGYCFAHSQDSFRGAVNDVLDLERRRAGKNLGKIDEPMSLADGQRLLYGAIKVARILGWAWRWAE